MARVSRLLIVGAIVIGGVSILEHYSETAGARETLERLLVKHFEGKSIKVTKVSFPIYYSIPFLSTLDIIPSSFEGTFTAVTDKSTAGECGSDYKFTFVSGEGSKFRVEISGIELMKIGLCVT